MKERIGMMITKVAAVVAIISTACLDSAWAGIYVICGVSLIIAIAGMVKYYTYTDKEEI